MVSSSHAQHPEWAVVQPASGPARRSAQPASPSCPVHGYVIKGSWRYLEHQWTARAGDYVFEPPGETHTLVVDADVEEMITFFNISGCMYYVNDRDEHTGFEDVFTKIDMCRKHYIEAGLGEDYVDQFIR
ncbi:MAG: 2,4'-dihydroxyacetophenone dioxygenase family protein [Bryobacteraceae bacterium]